MRPVRALLGSAAGALVLAGAATSASADVELAPVSRLPFPERGYVVGVSKAAHLDARSVVVRENGLRVTDVRVDPVAKSGIRFGVVLALDASDSMAGAPAAASLEAARAFVLHRTDAEEVGIVAFNSEISVLRELTD